MADRRCRVVVAGGGTGGHVFPALAVADEMRRRHPAAEIVFVGGKRGIETRLVPAAGYPLRALPVSGLKGATLPARLAAVAAAGVAVARCTLWMLRERPRLVIGVGGYASGPAVLAAKLLGVRTMVMEQNHFPGATNRWLARRVTAVCVPSESARRRLGGIGVVTGNPVRSEFSSVGDPPAAARLSILVFGGSRGARSINRAVVEALPVLARMEPTPRITHQTGTDDEGSTSKAYRDRFPGPSEVRAFFDDMPARVAAADLVLCRAGATTLAELAAAGRPAILVPYPHAADDHQRRNAEAVAEAGAAVVVPDRELNGDRVAREIARLDADRSRLRLMAEAARRLGRPEAARLIADVADALLSGRRAPRVEAGETGGGADVP